MSDPKMNADVGVNINPKGMEAAMSALNAQMTKFIGQIETAGAKTNQVLKGLATVSKNLQFVGNFNAQQMLGPARDNNLGKQIRQMQDWQQGIRSASDAMQALRGRMASFNVEAAKLTRDGKTPPMLDYKRVEDTAKAYGKISNEIQGMRGRINLLSEDGRKAFQPMLRSLDELDKKNAKIFANPNLFNFAGETRSMQMMAQGMKERLVAREKIEAKTRLNVETLRQEARQIVNNTRLEREAALAKSVRSANQNFNNQALLGNQPFNRNIDWSAREARATAALTVAKAKLNAELKNPATDQNAAAIAKLTGQYERLLAAQGKAIAAQTRVNAEQGKAGAGGGFFSGMSQGISRVTQGAIEGGGMFGAGALIGRVGTYALAATAIYGVITALKQGVTFAIQFEDRLAQLQAISGSTAMEMDRLSKGILDVSKNSANSIIEITEAATVIAQAGYGGSELGQMLQDVVNLSAASGASPTESVDILTSALGAFQLSATESTRITDGLVAALNNSKLAVGQVQLALQYLGNTANENNISFEELVATTGSMADAGIRSGSTIATGLRQMLVDFMDPSEKLVAQLTKIGLTTADIDVKVLGLNEVLRRLRDAGFEAYGTIETRASAAYVAASANLDNTERLLESMNQSGIAAEAAATRTDSLAAKWQQLLNSFSETGTLLGTLVIPLVKALVVMVTSLVDAVNYLLSGIGKLVVGLLELVGVTRDAGMSAEDFEQKLISSGMAADDVVNLMDKLGGSVGDLETLMKDAGAEVTALEERQATLASETDKLIVRQDQLAGTNGNLTETTSAVSAEVNNLAARFPGLRSEFAKTEGGILGLIQAMVNLENQAVRTLRATAFAQKTAAEGVRDEANTEATALKASARRSGRMLPGASYNPNTMTGRDAKLAADYKKYIDAGNWNAAQDLYRSAPAGSKFRKNATFKDYNSRMANFRQKYETSTSTIESADRTIDRADFSLTPEGIALRRDVRLSTANATTASSQGSVGGTGRAAISRQIDNRISTYEKRFAEAQAKDPEGAIAGMYAEGLASLRAAANQLRPDPEKADKKRAGGGKGRSAADRAAERERQLYQRNEADIAREELEYKKKLFENTLEAIENAPTFEDLPDLLNDLDKDMSEWLAAETETALAAIEKNKPTPEQRERLEAAAGRKAAELRVGALDKSSETLSKAVKKFVDKTSEAIERQYSEAMRFTQRSLAIAQGRLNGLNDPLNNGRVPEYMKTIAQREVDVANDRNNQASIGANARRISQYEEMAAKAGEARRVIKSTVDSDFGKLQSARAAGNESEIVVTAKRATQSLADLNDIDRVLEDLRIKTETLTDANAALSASYEALNNMPTTFSEGLRMAAQSMQIEIGKTNSFGQELINNLDQPLRALHEGFKGFFSDMLSGSVTVGQAFKNLAGSVIDAINQMIAVALAKKFFSLIMTAFGGVGNTGALDNLMAQPLPVWNGGPITGRGSGTTIAKRMYGGGSIMGGLATRDSTLVHAAKGEYLLRRPAAQSLGKGMLDAMNARGAHALKGMQSPQMMMPVAPPVNTNVYVIAPEEKPQMGPNDVVAAFSNDVLRGGITKKLIKRVASGG